MSLRSRLMLSVALALIISLAAAGGLASFRAVQSVETELRSALDVSERMVRNAANRSLEFEDAEEYLRLLIAAFADNRHVNARP